MIDRLLSLNRTFYQTFAEHFSESRSLHDPALTSILPYIPEHARVLDVGCGNGRLALLLDRERPNAEYVGVDVTPELIEVAQEDARVLESVDAAFRVVDVARPGWAASLQHAGPFDRVIALAVFHHLPDFDLRVRVLREMGSVLAPGGRVLLSTWQFMAAERLRRKIVDWEGVGIDVDALDPGDYLLDWKRGGRGLRYCHLIDEGELEQLADGAGFRVEEIFRAGGREGNLSLFGVLRPVEG